MPSKVRIISGPRDTSFDHFIREASSPSAMEQERTYFGIESEERAKFVRQKLKTAGRHMKPPVAVKPFYYECNGCANGGPSCRYHVSFTCYDMDKARAYKQAQRDYADGAVSNG